MKIRKKQFSASRLMDHTDNAHCNLTKHIPMNNFQHITTFGLSVLYTFSSICVHTATRHAMYYYVTMWRIRVMFIPPRLSEEPDTISLEVNVFMVI